MTKNKHVLLTVRIPLRKVLEQLHRTTPLSCVRSYVKEQFGNAATVQLVNDKEHDWNDCEDITVANYWHPVYRSLCWYEDGMSSPRCWMHNAFWAKSHWQLGDMIKIK